jgi:hypothetical protein
VAEVVRRASATVVAVQKGGERTFFHTPGVTPLLDAAAFRKCFDLFRQCAWVQIGLALAGSGQAADRQLAKHIASFVRGVTDSNKVTDLSKRPERPQEAGPYPTRPTDQQQTYQQPTQSPDVHPSR